MKQLLYGAAAATLLGLLFGAGLKAEISPRSSYGQQLLVSKPYTRDPNAFDAWYPSGGPPMPWMELAALPQGEELDALDRQIERLLRYSPFDRSASARAEAPAVVSSDHQPVEYAALPAQPQPYLPSASGDILGGAESFEQSDASYEPPPAAPPSWGWALPDSDGLAPASADAYAPAPGPHAAAG